MKRGLNICCGVLALALLFGGCAQSVPKVEPVATGAFAAEVEPEYVLHTAYMSAPKGFFGPDQPLRRAEAAQLVCNLAALSPKNLPESGFADVSPEAWYYGAVCAAAAFFEVPEPVSKPEAEAAGELNEVGAEDPDAPQEEPEPSYFRPRDAALAYELQGALTRALDLPDTALPAGMTDMTVLTRADAAGQPAAWQNAGPGRAGCAVLRPASGHAVHGRAVCGGARSGFSARVSGKRRRAMEPADAGDFPDAHGRTHKGRTRLCGR